MIGGRFIDILFLTALLIGGVTIPTN